MGEQEVQLILERFDDLKDNFNQRINILEELIGHRITKVENDLDNMCDDCKNSVRFEEKFDKQSLVNGAMWTVISAVWLVLGAFYAYFYSHVTGK